jgi:serine phosphatase RsbU (regulator of sigma subunit)
MAVVVMVQNYRHPPTLMARAQIKWILWALMLSVASFACNILLDAYPLADLWYLGAVLQAVPAVLVPMAIGFAVLRFRLFDVDRVVRATVIYVLLTALLVALYALVALAFSRALPLVFGPSAQTALTASVVAALAVGLVTQQIHRRLSAAIDALAFRERVARQRYLSAAMSELGRAIPLAEVTRFLTSQTQVYLGLHQTWLALPQGQVPAAPAPAPVPPLWSLCRSLDGPTVLLSDEVLGNHVPMLSPDEPAVAGWHAAGAQIIVPLRTQAPATSEPPAVADSAPAQSTDELVGIWILSGRKVDELPDRDDLAMLAQVGRQAALLIGYDRLNRVEVERALVDQDLERAREIQRDLLPSPVPYQSSAWRERLEIAWRFRPAREMSGDFYDLFTIPVPDKPHDDLLPLQVTVGDVEGKSVGAALVMALTQATIRTAASARRERSPALTLSLTGELLYQHRGQRQFVACALAVIENRGRDGNNACLLRLANAGFIPPLLYRDGQMTELLPDGERFPLGVVAKPAYADLEIALQPGDVIIFASDGLPEAPQQATPSTSLSSATFYGFQRLETAVEMCARQGPDAEAIASGIWADVVGWCGEQPLHDDMTLLVLRVLAAHKPHQHSTDGASALKAGASA